MIGVDDGEVVVVGVDNAIAPVIGRDIVLLSPGSETWPKIGSAIGLTLPAA
ncbi:MAG: hypothetical protein ACRC9N_08485 [Aeromonas sp.]